MSNNDAFGQRLQSLLKEKGLTQSDLADLLGTSQPAVSQWCSGKKPPGGDKIAKIAELLDTTPEWLEHGKKLSGRDTKAPRQDYDQLSTWYFRPAPPDGGRDYGNANVWSFNPGLDDLVRETLQNSCDAATGVEQVRVTYRIIKLSGQDLTDYKKALCWQAMSNHLEASTKNGQKLGTLIRDGLQQIKERDELLLLVIEDAGTTGLIGSEKSEGKFTALCRNNLDSHKEGASTRGGAFGLGKAVLWRASRLSTVVFSSNLSVPDEHGRSELRLLGRCELPWHEVADGPHAGPGWFGQRTDEGDAVSFWGNEALAQDLYLNREESGTTACVVGFHDASSDEDRKPKDLATEIIRATAEFFFPALAFGKLAVRVEVYENGRQYKQQDPSFSQMVNVTELQPDYCKMLAAFRRGETLDQFGDSDEVAIRRVKLEVPKRKLPRPQNEQTHEAVLLVAPPGDTVDTKNLNRLALFRGPGMVIDSLNLSGLCLGARPFYAMLLCGKAVEQASESISKNTDAASAAEDFLAAAEPPSHNKWMATPDLKSSYALGCKKRLDDFIRRAKDSVRELIRPMVEDSGDGPNSIKELFKIGSEPELPERPRIAWKSGSIDEEGRWQIEAKVRIKPRKNQFRIAPAVLFLAETGSGMPVRWEFLEAIANCESAGQHLLVPRDTREVRFRGGTDIKSHPIPAKDSCIDLDIRVLEGDSL